MDISSSTKHTSYRGIPHSETLLQHYQDNTTHDKHDKNVTQRPLSFAKYSPAPFKSILTPFVAHDPSQQQTNHNQPVQRNSSFSQAQLPVSFPLRYENSVHKLQSSSLTSNNDVASYSNITDNYINEVKSMYENESDKMTQKVFALQNEMNSTRATLHDKINDYEHRINELQRAHNFELVDLENQYKSKLKKEMSTKDEQLKLLIEKNNELTRSNEELLVKLNRYLEIINTSKHGYDDKVVHLECEKETIEKDIADMKRYYEGKMEFLQMNFNEEKRNLINSYETNIAQLKEGYNESKESLQRLCLQKDIDAKDVAKELKNENEKLLQINRESKEKIKELTEGNLNLTKENKAQEYELECLKIELEKAKNENAFYFKEKSKVEEEYYNLNKEHNLLKHREAKLDRLTYGKLKKK